MPSTEIVTVSEAQRLGDLRETWQRRVLPFKCEPPRNIPISFFPFWDAMYGRPMRGYQAWALDQLFPACYESDDISFKMARQAGKTVPLAMMGGWFIVVESWPFVVMSSKQEKTRKIGRILLRCMRQSGRKLIVEGVQESRFDMVSGVEPGFVCVSGKPLSERESETAKIVLADESQDILHEAVWEDISPMLLSTDGCVLSIGIGGTRDSLIEALRLPTENIRIDIPWTDVLNNWGVPDGKDKGYRKRVMKDKRILRPEIFSAHYECQPIPEGAAALYKQIIPWSQAYPGKPFDINRYLGDPATRYRRANIGIDWGKRNDASACLLVASNGTEADDGRSQVEIVICGYLLLEGMDYMAQMQKIVEWVDRPDVPYGLIQPEVNGVGEMGLDVLRSHLGNARYRHGCEEIRADDAVKSEVTDIISQAAQTGRLIYVDEAADPLGQCRHMGLQFAEACASDLRSVGIKYTQSARGTLKRGFSHSDWNSALIAAVAQPQTARVI